MGVFVRPFKAKDLKAFKPLERLPVDDFVDSPELAKAAEKSNLAVTGIRNGKIVGCGGVHPIDDVHGELWLRLSADCVNHKIDTVRWLKCGFDIVCKTFPFRQLNAVIRCDFERGKRLVEWLGLKPVQLMTHEGEKYTVYAKRVRD